MNDEDTLNFGEIPLDAHKCNFCNKVIYTNDLHLWIEKRITLFDQGLKRDITIPQHGNQAIRICLMCAGEAFYTLVSERDTNEI